ncbi:MAG: DUF3800 domain-containing protein [Anaerolineales bacterium]|nr:MAG: DUF3800 domain-containing protein [Anaerolineales bacterium]
MAKNARSQNKSAATTRHYFVDEGGDSTLFASRGKVIIDTEGCSRFFMLGLLDIADPVSLKQRLDDLRARLMSDPYFNNVPSMQPQAGKTALAFHAKDDLPEIRREVLALLREIEGLRYFAVVTDKWSVLDYVRQQNVRNPGYRYHPNELYDYLTRRLFKNLLHKDGGYEIVFATRGASDRTSALQAAIETARERFAQQWGIFANAPTHILSSTPVVHAGLQAADYFTWALQRMYEKGEDRYLNYLWKSVHLVQDIDDKREAGYGVYYTQKKPLTTAALEWRKQNKMPGI